MAPSAAPVRKFEVVVEGQYIALGEASGAPTVKGYTAKFILPSQEAALSVVCKHLLSPYLRKNYKDFIRFRTHKLKSITAIGQKPNTEVLQMSIEDMTISQLSDFCILKGIMIDPYRHSNLEQTRERITEAYRAVRQSVKDQKDSGESDKQKEVDALLAANQLPPEGDKVQVNVREREATAAVTAKQTVQPVAAAPGAEEPIEDDLPLPPPEPDPAGPAGPEGSLE